MTGADCFTASQQALKSAVTEAPGSAEEYTLLVSAQVYATLAAAAATAEAGALVYKTGSKPSPWWVALHGQELK